LCSLSRLRSLCERRAGPRFPDRLKRLQDVTVLVFYRDACPPAAAPLAPLKTQPHIRNLVLLVEAPGRMTLFIIAVEERVGGVAKAAKVEVKSCCALLVARVSASFARAFSHPQREWNDYFHLNPTRWSSFDTGVSPHGTSEVPGRDPAQTEIASRPAGDLICASPLALVVAKDGTVWKNTHGRAHGRA